MYQLSQDQIDFQARARDLAQNVIAPRAAEVDRTEQYPWDNVQALKDAGFIGITIPKELGGQGRSFLDAVILIVEMAKVCGVTGRIAVECNMGAVSAVMKYGDDAQRKMAAEIVLSGDKPAICITEPDAGSAASEMTTRADKKGDAYIINGKKHWITGGGVSRLHLIFARVFENGMENGIAGFLAVRDPNTQTPKGLRIGDREPTMGLRGIPEAEIYFEDLEIAESMMIIPPEGLRRGFAGLMNAYNSQRVGAAAVSRSTVQVSPMQSSDVSQGESRTRAPTSPSSPVIQASRNRSDPPSPGNRIDPNPRPLGNNAVNHECPFMRARVRGPYRCVRSPVALTRWLWPS